MRWRFLAAVLVASFAVGSDEHTEREEGVEEVTDPAELAELGSTSERHDPDHEFDHEFDEDGGGELFESDHEFDEDGHDEAFIDEHLPDVNEKFEDDQGYNADRDMLGFDDETVSDIYATGHVEAKFQEHFLQLDTNADGFLDYSELDKQLRSTMLRHYLQAEEHAKRHANDLFVASDVDKDGKISSNEFFSHLESIEYDPKAMTSDGYAAVHKASQHGVYKKRFKFADENDDAALSAEEFYVYKYPEHSKRSREFHYLESELYISRFDTNHDTKLSQKEIDDAKEAVDPHVFASYDLNEDGFLDKVELSRLHYPDVQDIKTHIQKVDDEIEFLLQHISSEDHGEGDDPKAIRLSRDECHEHKDYFVHQVHTYLNLGKADEEAEGHDQEVEGQEEPPKVEL
jgi:Ca2+-binding EF-hand superfamily protein